MNYSRTIANAADENGDSLTYSIVPGGPSWLNVETNGVLSGTVDVGSDTAALNIIDNTAPSGSTTLAVGSVLNSDIKLPIPAQMWNSPIRRNGTTLPVRRRRSATEVT